MSRNVRSSLAGAAVPQCSLRKIFKQRSRMANIPTIWRINIAENFNRLSRVHERYRRQTDRRTDGR